MSLSVHVERLVIDAGLGLDPRKLEAALAEGLAQALLQPGLPLLQQEGSIGILQGAALTLDRSPAGWGDQFAGALRSALANAAYGDAPGAQTIGVTPAGERVAFRQRGNPA
jgi:hypothetical protein